MNEALNSVKPIVSNPFHEKVANSEKSIKDVVLKNTIKVAFINQIAKNF